MALGIPVISILGRRRRLGAGPGAPKLLNGRIGFSANSAFVACGVEKFFRVCHDIQINLISGAVMQYKKSTTKNAGIFTQYFVSAYISAAGGDFGRGTPGVLSGTFTATGL